jgi:hypothetical protein
VSPQPGVPSAHHVIDTRGGVTENDYRHEAGMPERLSYAVPDYRPPNYQPPPDYQPPPPLDPR